MAKSKTISQTSGLNKAQVSRPVDPLASGELPLRSNAEPMTIRTITKLDQRSMVWAYDGVATEVEAQGPFIALLITAMVGFVVWMMAQMLLYPDPGDGVGLAIGLWIGIVLMLALELAVVIYCLKISIFSTYGDVHFNRHTGKVYTSENKLALQLDWRHIRPMAISTVGPLQLGAPTLMSLMLVEYEPDQPNVWKAKFVAAGPLPNREGCQQVWELIRRYMEDPPESMPKLEVVPEARSWTNVLISFGPLANLKEPSQFLAQLRANRWVPWINPLILGWWILAPSFPLSTTLYAKYRRKAKLPAEWTHEETPPAGEKNPYRSGALDPTEMAGRRRAARIIGGIAGVCILIGVTAWSTAIWYMFPHH